MATIVQSSPLEVVNGAQTAVTTLSGVTAGNAIVITASQYSPSANDAPVFKDGSTTLTQYNAYTPGGNYSSAAVGWELAVAAGSHTITAEFASAVTAGYYNFMVHEVSGLGTTQPSVTVSGTTTGATLALSGATPAQNGCIVFTAIADDANLSSSTATATAPSGYTPLWSDMAGSTSQVGAAAYQIQTTAAPVSPAWTGLNAGGGVGWSAVAVAFAPAGGGTTYNQSVTGSLVPAGSLQVQSAHAQTLAGSITPAGSLLKQTSKGLSGTVTAAGALAKRTARSLAGSVIPAGALTTMSVISKAISGTITAAGSLATSLIPAPTAATLLFHVGHADVSGSGTSPMPTSPIDTPSTISLIVIAIAGQSDSTFATPTVTDNKGNTYTQVGTTHNYAGITAPTALYKCDNAVGGTGHIFYINKASATDEATIMVTGWDSSGMGAESYTGTGTYTAGPLTTTGNNSCVASYWYPADYSGVNPSVYTTPSGWTGLDFFENGLNTNSGADAYIAVPTSGTGVTATWSSAQTLQPTQGHWLVEILAPTGGTLFTKALSGTITAAGALIKQTQRGLSGAITAAGALTKRTALSIAASIAPAGAVIKRTATSQSGSITPAGSLTANFTLTKVLSGAISVTGGLAKSTLKALNGSMQIAGHLVKETRKNLGATIAVAGTVTVSTVLYLTLNGSLTLLGALTATKHAIVVGALRLLAIMGIGQ